MHRSDAEAGELPFSKKNKSVQRPLFPLKLSHENHRRKDAWGSLNQPVKKSNMYCGHHVW